MKTPTLLEAALSSGALRDETDAAEVEYLDLTLNELQHLRPTSLEGLERFPRLRALQLCADKALSLRPLAATPLLEHLTLQAHRLTELDVVSGLKHLSSLALFTRAQGSLALKSKSLVTLSARGCGIKDVELATPALEELDLSDNKKLGEVSFSGLRRLRKLGLSGVPLSDLSSLEALSQLEDLDVSDTAVASLKPLFGLTNLRELKVVHTRVKSIAGITALTRLRGFYCFRSPIKDLELVRQLPALEVCPGLQPPLPERPEAPPTALEPDGDGPVSLALAYGSRLARPQRWKGLRALFLSHEEQVDRAWLGKLRLTHLSTNERLSALDELPPMPHLEHLEVSGDGLSLRGLEQFPRLRVLRVTGSTSGDLAPLSIARQLLSLDLGTCPTGDLSPLAACSQLRRFALYGAGKAKLDTAILTALSSLRSLDVRGATLSDVSALRSFAEKLPHALID